MQPDRSLNPVTPARPVGAMKWPAVTPPQPVVTVVNPNAPAIAMMHAAAMMGVTAFAAAALWVMPVIWAMRAHFKTLSAAIPSSISAAGHSSAITLNKLPCQQLVAMSYRSMMFQTK